MRLQNSTYRVVVALVCAGAGLLLAGCSFLPKASPDPTRHYVLTGPSSADINAGLRAGKLKVGLRTIQVAPYLDSKAMIVRRGENEIDYRDYARWAEPLVNGITRTLLGRLVLSEKIERVLPQPYPFDVIRDVDVAITVLRCEGRVGSDGKATVSFLCGLELVRVGAQSGGGAEVLLREVFEAPETSWREGDYAELAAAISRHVGLLAERIDASLPAE